MFFLGIAVYASLLYEVVAKGTVYLGELHTWLDSRRRQWNPLVSFLSFFASFPSSPAPTGNSDRAPSISTTSLKWFPVLWTYNVRLLAPSRSPSTLLQGTVRLPLDSLARLRFELPSGSQERLGEPQSLGVEFGRDGIDSRLLARFLVRFRLQFFKDFRHPDVSMEGLALWQG